MFKLNVDASLSYDDSTGSCGPMIQDDAGDFVVAKNFFTGPIADAHTAEAMALKRIMSPAHVMGIEHLLVQSDCSDLTDRTRSELESPLCGSVDH